MSVEEVELGDLLTQTLESNGSLAKIRAQLRASVFLALDEDPKVSKKEPLLNGKIKSYLEMPEGEIMFCVVREFLEFFNLDFTISVYEPESYMGNCYKYRGRQKLVEDLGIKGPDDAYPILLHLIKIAQIKSKSLQINLNVNGNTSQEDLREPSETSSVVEEKTLTESGSVEEYSDNSTNINSNSFNGHEISEKSHLEAILSPQLLNATFIKEKLIDDNLGQNPIPDESVSVINIDNSLNLNFYNSIIESETSKVLLDETLDERKADKKAKTADFSPLNKPHDILPSLYSKEFKDKANMKELDKVFDLDAEYEEDFMSPSDADLSVTNSNCSSKTLLQELQQSQVSDTFGISKTKSKVCDDADIYNNSHEDISLSNDDSNQIKAPQ